MKWELGVYYYPASMMSFRPYGMRQKNRYEKKKKKGKTGGEGRSGEGKTLSVGGRGGLGWGPLLGSVEKKGKELRKGGNQKRRATWRTPKKHSLSAGPVEKNPSSIEIRGKIQWAMVRGSLGNCFVTEGAGRGPEVFRVASKRSGQGKKRLRERKWAVSSFLAEPGIRKNPKGEGEEEL